MQAKVLHVVLHTRISQEVEERDIRHCQQSLNLENKTAYSIFLDVKKQEMHSRDVSELSMQTEDKWSMLKLKNTVIQQSKILNAGTKWNIARHTMKQ